MEDLQGLEAHLKAKRQEMLLLQQQQQRLQAEIDSAEEILWKALLARAQALCALLAETIALGEGMPIELDLRDCAPLDGGLTSEDQEALDSSFDLECREGKWSITLEHWSRLGTDFTHCRLLTREDQHASLQLIADRP